MPSRKNSLKNVRWRYRLIMCHRRDQRFLKRLLPPWSISTTTSKSRPISRRKKYPKSPSSFRLAYRWSKGSMMLRKWSKEYIGDLYFSEECLLTDRSREFSIVVNTQSIKWVGRWKLWVCTCFIIISIRPALIWKSPSSTMLVKSSFIRELTIILTTSRISTFSNFKSSQSPA